MGTIFMEGGTKNFYYGKITQLSTTKFKTFFNDNTIETFQLVPRGDGLMAERNNRPLHFVRFPSMVLASTYATAFNQVMSGGGIVKDAAAAGLAAVAAAAEAEVGKVAILPLYKNGANFLSGKGTGYSAKLKLFRLVYGNAKPKEGIQYKFNLIYTTHTFPAWLEYRQVQRKVEMYVKAEDRHVLQSCVRAREGDLSVSVGTPKAETALRFKLTAVKTVSLAIVV